MRLLYCVSALLLSTSAVAQPTTLASTAPGRPGPDSTATVSASRTFTAVRTASPPSIDGRLDDAMWASAVPIEGFRQREPEEGAEASQRTVVRVLYDDAALYISARMHDTAPDSIVARLGRRDADVHTDFFMVALDPYHDRRSGYYFGLSAAGTLYDGVLYNDGWDDSSWDGVWEGRVARDAEGWTAEFRIPYSQLRFSRADVQVWGVNFRRDIARRQERAYLQVVPSTENGFVSFFPDLVGIERIRPARGFEVVPYVTSRAELTDQPAGNPFDDGSDFEAEAGADFRLGLTSNLTLNGTLNPDFGQVEVDPAVVNLSAFETFFEERRPFFVEGSSIFEFGYGGSSRNMGFNWVNLDPFYSRRIGRAPGGVLPAHEYADRPASTRILGAAKLTGRLGATSVGVLSSVTGRGIAQLQVDGAPQEVEVEPLAHYGVVRALREFDSGAHGLGVLGTAVNRDIRDDLQRGFFNTGAYVGGVDGWTRFGDGMWVLKGWATASHVTGSEDQIARLQRTAVHYLQRPDREHFRYDPTRTSLTGFAGRLALDKTRGNWIVNAALGVVSPTYDLNDVGFLGRTDLLNAHLFVGHHSNEVKGPTRTRLFMAAAWNNLDFDGNRTSTGFWGRTELQFTNYWFLTAGSSVGLANIDPYMTRGGPLVWTPIGVDGDFWLSTDSRKALQLGFGSYGGIWEGGSNVGGDINLTWQPRPNVNVSFGPGYFHNVTDAQYVTARPDELATETFGSRYVFAHLNQWQVSGSLRLNWTFTPTMSLQLFAQPLVASGAYSEFKEFARPRTFDFNLYEDVEEVENEDGSVTVTVDPDAEGPAAPFSFGRPDFRFASLRGNAVFRWEYRPGSTLYLVWTQQREDFEPDGVFRFGHAANRLLNVPSDNVFALKVTYWLGR